MPKRQKRVEIVSKEYEDLISSTNENLLYSSKPNEELFIVDKVGSKTARKKISKEEGSTNNTRKAYSATEQKLIKRLQEKISIVSKEPKGDIAVNDIWADQPSAEPKRYIKKTERKVPISGFSYNPSPDDHQDVIAEAVALELKHQEELTRNSKAFDKFAIVDSSGDIDKTHSESESDGSDSEDIENGSTSMKKGKLSEKMSRAKRNKKRLNNIRSFEKSKEDTEKQLLKDIEQVERISREIVQEELVKKRKMEIKKIQTSSSSAEEEDSLTLKDVSTVPLSDELHGNLRSLQPKGNIVLEHVRGMEKSGELGLKNTRKRRKTEKPHAPKNIKWHAKYKY